MAQEVVTSIPYQYVSAAIAATTSLLLWLLQLTINHFKERKEKEARLRQKLDELLKIAIQYPYLEHPSFTETWESKKSSECEKLMRYEVYGIQLFNYLSDVCEHFNYKREKIESFIAIRNWARMHKKYWQDPITPYENTDTYDEKFSSIINGYLK